MDESTVATGMETIITNTGPVVSGFLGWMGDVADAVTGNPIMAVMCLGVPFITLAIGLFKTFTKKRGS